MELKKISIENFKCFNAPVEIELGKITLLTGANSSGKSSIIYAILGALQSGEFPYQFSTNGKYVNMGDFREIVFGHDRKKEIRLGFEFEGKQSVKVDTAWKENPKSKLPELVGFSARSSYFDLAVTAKKGSFEVDFNYYPDRDIDFSRKNALEFGEVIKNLALLKAEIRTDLAGFDRETKQKLLEPLIDSVEMKGLNLHHLPQPEVELEMESMKNLEDLFKIVLSTFLDFDDFLNYISSFRLHPERTYYEQTKSGLKVGKHGDGYLDQILYWETKDMPKFKELIKILRKLGLLTSMKSKRMDGGRYEISIQVEKDGIDAAISDVGFGISQFMPILVADLQLPNSSTLFVSQPEIHLHPSIQSSYGDYLMDQVKEKSKNYVVETHSEYLLNKIRLGIVKGDIKEEDVKIYFIESNKQGNIIHQLQFNRQGQILNAPPDFFKTYMMDVMEIAIQAAAES